MLASELHYYITQIQYGNTKEHPHSQKEKDATTLKQASLAGTLTHLPTLTTKTPHPLLPPLGTHASGNIEEESDLVVLLDPVPGQSAARKLDVSGNEADEVTGNEFLVLDHDFEVADGGAAFHGIGRGGARGSCYDDLHLESVQLGCSKPDEVSHSNGGREVKKEEGENTS